MADDGVHGLELWTSDGTAEGTRLVKDILPGPDGAFPRDLTDVNGTLYFAAHDGLTGRELWKSDGTEAGTVRVADIHPGIGSAAPSALANVDGTLFFRATDGLEGTELWRTVLPQPVLSLSLGATTVAPGEGLSVDVGLANPGPDGPVDVFFGLLLPPAAGPALGCPAGDAVAFLTGGFGAVVFACASSPPQSFAPLVTNQPLPGDLPAVTIPGFFTLPWPVGVPPGPYTVFLLLTVPQAIADGRITPAELLALATVAFAATP
jgi:ELWxxDGT repeat protein